MSGLKAFNIVAMPKNLHSDPILKRRGKMLAQLEQQLSLENDAGYMLIVQKWKSNRTLSLLFYDNYYAVPIAGVPSLYAYDPKVVVGWQSQPGDSYMGGYHRAMPAP